MKRGCKPRKTHFAAKFHGRDVFKINVPRSGISYTSLLEWVLASIWANYKPPEFLELDVELQALIIAAYRTNNQIEAVLAKDRADKQKATSRKR